MDARGPERPGEIHVLFCTNRGYYRHAAVAAVSATGPAERLAPERLQELGKDLLAVLPTQLPQGLSLP